VNVLFLDDDGNRHEMFRKENAHNHVIDFVWTAQDAIAKLQVNAYDLACLDHDLGGKTFVPSDGPEETGYTVAKAITGMHRKPKRVVVHSFNPVGVQNMLSVLRAAGVSVIAAPFGTFKLAASPPVSEAGSDAKGEK
jgi:hypothetical protein